MEKVNLQGFFNLLDYNITHSRVLFRCSQTYESKGYNTDLIFESVFFMEIPSHFQDVRIYEADEPTFNYIQDKCISEIYKEQHDNIFVLESCGKKYYIGCWRFLINETSLLPLESSIEK